jgi:ribosomal protein L11 methyltransferase
VTIAAENIRRNGLRARIRAGKSRGTEAHLVRRHAPYDLIMANIFAGPLSRMAPAVRRHLKPGGSVILAGMLNMQAPRVLSAFRAQRLVPSLRLTIGEWTILWCRRPNWPLR